MTSLSMARPFSGDATLLRLRGPDRGRTTNSCSVSIRCLVLAAAAAAVPRPPPKSRSRRRPRPVTASSRRSRWRRIRNSTATAAVARNGPGDCKRWANFSRNVAGEWSQPATIGRGRTPRGVEGEAVSACGPEQPPCRRTPGDRSRWTRLSSAGFEAVAIDIRERETSNPVGRSQLGRGDAPADELLALAAASEASKTGKVPAMSPTVPTSWGRSSHSASVLPRPVSSTEMPVAGLANRT